MNKFYQAANEIQGGWTQGKLEDGIGRVCMVGGLSRAINGEADVNGLRSYKFIIDRRYDFLNQYISEHTDFPTAMHYNDYEWRKKEDVVAMMRRVGDAWEVERDKTSYWRKLKRWADSKLTGLPKEPVDLPIITPNALKPGFRQERTSLTVNDVLQEQQYSPEPKKEEVLV
jgi:hypothetical protein